MRYARGLRAFLAVFVVVCSLLALVPAASAATTARTVTWMSRARDGTRTVVTLRFDAELPSAAELARLRLETDDADNSAAVAVGNTAGQPRGAYLHCNRLYSFSDSNGTFTTQHACGGRTTPWGF